MKAEAASRIYGPFEFDHSVVRGYWYTSGLLVFAVIAVASFGIAAPLFVLWLLGGHWLISKDFQRRYYEVDEDSVNIRKGIIFHVEKVIPLEKITDVKLVQGPLMRCFGAYNVMIQTAGSGTQMPEGIMTFESPAKATEVRERIMTARQRFRSGLLGVGTGDD